MERSRRPVLPGRGLLGVAAVVTIVAAFLPWVDSAWGTFGGMSGPGRVTFYAGFIGMAGALHRRPAWLVWHAALLAAAALSVPIWQTVRLVAVCPPLACIPTAGLLLTFGAATHHGCSQTA
jgi:hypothetical protein